MYNNQNWLLAILQADIIQYFFLGKLRTTTVQSISRFSTNNYNSIKPCVYLMYVNLCVLLQPKIGFKCAEMLLKILTKS